MPINPNNMLDRPEKRDEEIDVLSDVLRTTRLGSVHFARLEFGAPWGLKVLSGPQLSVYVMARGSAVLEVGEEISGLSAGDVVLVRVGQPHVIRDTSADEADLHEIIPARCPSSSKPRSMQVGTSPFVNTLLFARVHFGEGIATDALSGLPPMIHLRSDDPRVSATMHPTTQVLIAETTAPTLGSPLLLERLADVLLIQILRSSFDESVCQEPGLMRALHDPRIANVLEHIHATYPQTWSVEGLARVAAMSRSAFATRFHTVCGVPPMIYLTRWRVLKAAETFRESSDNVTEVARSVGYESVPAFSRTFKKYMGISPGAYQTQAHAHLSVG